MLNSDSWISSINASEYWDKFYTQVYTIHAGAYETIIIDGYGGSFTTNADGTCTHLLPLGELTLTGSISEQSFTRTITNDISYVYVMPEDALYRYAKECADITGGWNTTTYGSEAVAQKNADNIYLHSYRANTYTMNKVNLSNFSKLVVLFSEVKGRSDGSQYTSASIRVHPILSLYYVWAFNTSSPTKAVYDIDNANTILYKTSATNYKLELDISDIESEQYIEVAINGDTGDNETYGYISEIYLE